MYLNRVPENTSQGREAEAGRSSIRISDFGFRGGAVCGGPLPDGRAWGHV